MTVTFDKITAPSYWASYLINGDASGLNDAEIAMADNWAERNGVIDVVDCEEEAHFTWHYRLYCPEADCDGGDVMEYTVRLKQ